jgi:hypothetical protein
LNNNGCFGDYLKVKTSQIIQNNPNFQTFLKIKPNKVAVFMDSNKTPAGLVFVKSYFFNILELLFGVQK